MNEPSTEFDWRSVIEADDSAMHEFVGRLVSWLIKDNKNPAHISGRVHAIIYTFGFSNESVQELADRSWVSKGTMMRFISELTEMEGIESQRQHRARPRRGG